MAGFLPTGYPAPTVLVTVPVDLQIRWICGNPGTANTGSMETGKSAGSVETSGFASIHGPCVSSSRVSTYPADLPVSMDPVLAVPGFPQIQRICQYP